MVSSSSLRWVSCAAAVAAVAALSSCGGGGGNPAAPSTPTAAATAAPPTTLAARPAPTPTPDPRIGWAQGPVTRYNIYVRTANPGNFQWRDVQQDDQGRWVVYPGERVDIDGTQKNDGGEKCQWINDPVYFIDNDTLAFEATSESGVVYRRGSSNPFTLKLTIERKGTFFVHSYIDGIRSNTLEFVSAQNQ